MGSSPTKPKPNSADSSQNKPLEKSQQSKQFLQMKERQINLNEMIELSQKTNQPLDSIDKAIGYLEKQGIIVEKGLLGVGGCGFVLKACSEWNDHLAVKFMKYTNLEQFESNKREFQILQKFQSPYITKVYKCFTESHNSIDYQIIVMERCIYDLKNYITKKISTSKYLSHQTLYTLCIQLVKGLQVLHSKNILHLDIKPANILFGIDLKWKYADLGVSKQVSDQKQHTKNLTGFTATYSSPEQYQLMTSEKASKVSKSFGLHLSLYLLKIIDMAVTQYIESDVYSLGVVFLQLTGVDVTQKWILKEKISHGNYDKCLNPYYEEFNNRILKQMIKYKSSDRIDLQEIISILNELKENRNSSGEKITVSPLKKHKLSIEEELEENKKLQIKINESPESNYDEKHNSEISNNLVKVINVQKAVKRIRVRPISISNSIEKQDYQMNSLNIPQSDRVKNNSFHKLSSPLLNLNDNKKLIKLPLISPSYGSVQDNQAFLSTRESKNKFQSSLSNFDQLQSANNIDKKSSNNLPSIDEIESPHRSKKEQFFLPKINSQQNIQSMQYLSNNQFEYQSKLQIFASPQQQNQQARYFRSPEYSADRNKFYRLNNKNIFSTPFLPH